MKNPYLYFDGMTWPNPTDPNEVQWRLVHGTPTRSDVMWAASVIGAYRQLTLNDTQKVRNAKVSAIRKAQDVEEQQ